jgi:2-keto-4-pentenoate hydratase
LRTFIRLAQSLAERGEALTKGQIVITGSLAGVLQLPLGTGLRVRYGELGALQVEFLFAEACNTQGAAK